MGEPANKTGTASAVTTNATADPNITPSSPNAAQQDATTQFLLYNTLPTPSIGASLFLLAFALLSLYLTFRIMQTLWHLRRVRNSLQEADPTAVKAVLKDNDLFDSVKECCDGGFLWFPLIGAGFNLVVSSIVAISAAATVISAIRK